MAVFHTFGDQMQLQPFSITNNIAMLHKCGGLNIIFFSKHVSSILLATELLTERLQKMRYITFLINHVHCTPRQECTPTLRA